MAETYDFEIEQGSTFKWEITVYQADSTTLPLDLTNYEIRSQMRKKVSDVSPTVSFTCTKSATPTTGVVTLSLTDEQTALIASGRYVYDVEIESVGGDVAKLYRGAVVIVAEVTK